MKKYFFTMVLAASLCVSAKDQTVILHPRDTNHNTAENKYPRTPIRIPDAYIDGHTMTFDASCIGCTLTLTQDDIIIYSATVEENENGEGVVILPENLTGEYEVQIEFGSITLVGEIEL